MAKPTNLTVEILKQIRDEVVGLRSETVETRTTLRTEMSELRAEMSETRTALSERMDNLARVQTQTEVRLATELLEVRRAVNGATDLLRGSLADRDRMNDHERRLAALERRSA